MKKWILIVVSLQLFVLVFIAGKSEWIRAAGETVYLRTAPVDPRDLFRGDYVQLQYDINFPESDKFPEEWREIPNHQTIYASLEKGAGDIAEITAVHIDKPNEGLFIKGKARQNLWITWRSSISITYGIEKYFVEQGKGLELEQKRGSGQDWQTAMEVEVALGSDGTAIIKGYRWSEIDVRLEVEPVEQIASATNEDSSTNSPNQDQRSPKVTMSLRNQSSRAIEIPDTANHCSFWLLKNAQVTEETEALTMPNRDCANEQITIHSISPGESYSVTLDLSDPTFFVVDTNVSEPEVAQIADVTSSFLGFRLVYQPTKNSVFLGRDSDSLLLTTLRSAQFNTNGRVD